VESKIIYLKVFGFMQTKGHKQDRQNRLRLLLPVGDEPYLYNNDYIL
jgi:hypothetical protein